LAVVLADKPAARPFKHFDTVDQPPRNDRDFLRREINDPQFSRKPKATFLRDEAQVTGGLTVEETATLARLLRTVLRTAEDLGPR